MCVSWKNTEVTTSLRLWENLHQAQLTLKQEYQQRYPDIAVERLAWMEEGPRECQWWTLKVLNFRGHLESNSTGIFLRELKREA